MIDGFFCVFFFLFNDDLFMMVHFIVRAFDGIKLLMGRWLR